MKKILIIVILICITVGIISLNYILKDTYYLVNSIPKSYNTIQISINNINKEIIDEKNIENIINLLKANNRKTKITSVNDYPYNADEIIKINIKEKDNITTIYVYKSNNKYYIEPPYNGIYKISSEEYNSIYKYVI